VGAPFDDKNTLVQLRRHALGNRQTEESGTDDKEVETSCHRQQGYPTATARPESDKHPRRPGKVAISSQFRIVTLDSLVTSVPSITLVLPALRTTGL
jgi:hypothetical protein